MNLLEKRQGPGDKGRGPLRSGSDNGSHTTRPIRLDENPRPQCDDGEQTAVGAQAGAGAGYDDGCRISPGSPQHWTSLPSPKVLRPG